MFRPYADRQIPGEMATARNDSGVAKERGPSASVGTTSAPPPLEEPESLP